MSISLCERSHDDLWALRKTNLSITMKPKTRFTNLDDFYAAINALIQWLQSEGHLEDSQRLDMLMHTAWTTSSEFIGEIMLALKSMKGKYSPALSKEISECLEFAVHHRKILRLDARR